METSGIRKKGLPLKCDIAFAVSIIAAIAFTYAKGLCDPLCEKQNSNELSCVNASTYESVGPDGLMDFTVVFANPYKENVEVSRYPNVDGERIVVRGTEVIWSGVYNLTEGKKVRETMISFYPRKKSEKKQCHHFYYLNCPSLDSTLEEKTNEWNNRTEKKTAWVAPDALNMMFSTFFPMFGFLMGFISVALPRRETIEKELNIQ